MGSAECTDRPPVLGEGPESANAGERRTMRSGFIAVLATALFTLSGCATPAAEVFYNASYPAFESVSELKEAADLVIEGEIISSAVRELDIASEPTGAAADDPELSPNGSERDTRSVMVFTVHEVQVQRVLKGSSIESERVQVKELGGTLGKTAYLTEGGVLLREGESYVMFLETYESTPASLLNPVQAAYQNVHGKWTSMAGNSLAVEDIAELS